MKVILASIHLESSTRSIPLAAACLKAVIKDHDVQLKDFTLEQDKEEIVHDLLRESPDVLGFPVYLWNRSLVLDVISLVRQLTPGIHILAGGPEVTAAPEAFLKESGVTAVMQGEGEVMINPVLDALAGNLPLPAIPGIWAEQLIPDSPAYCEDIDSLVSPVLSGALNLKDNEGLLWELSRGCPFACEFCFESKGCKKVRYFSMDRVRKELEMIRDSGVRQVFVLDPTFNVNKKRVLTILEWIGELTPSTYYYFEVRTEFLDEECAAAFAEIPCTLQIGLQSSDPEVLGRINRKFNPESFRHKIMLLGEAGVSFGLDLIYGLPGDTLEGFRNSLNYALSLEPNHLDIFPLSVLPGTVLYDRKEALNIVADAHDPYLVRETGDFSSEDMIRADEIRLSAESLYNRGRGISWFGRVCYDLDLEAAEVIDHWTTYRKSGNCEEEQIPEFLEFLYARYDHASLYPVIRDMLNYLDLLEELEQLAGSVPPGESRNLTEDTHLKLHDSVRFAEFSIPPDLILEGFPASSEELVSEAGHFHVLLWVRQEGVCMDILEIGEKKILTEIGKEGISCGELIRNRSMDGIDEFLLTGIRDGYLCRD